ncbi:hypothetical protein D3C77_319060 [compost metagenome]
MASTFIYFSDLVSWNCLLEQNCVNAIQESNCTGFDNIRIHRTARVHFAFILNSNIHPANGFLAARQAVDLVILKLDIQTSQRSDDAIQRVDRTVSNSAAF